jgi:uncharacterized membrane protein
VPDEPAQPPVEPPPVEPPLFEPPSVPPAYPPPSATPPPGAVPPGAQPPPGQQQPPPGYPPAGYQQPGYGPPPPGYGAPAGTPSLFSLAYSDGWKAFGRVGGAFVGALVVWGIAALAVLGVLSALLGAFRRVPGATGLGAFYRSELSFRNLVLSVVGALVLAFVQAQFVRAALAVTRGVRPAFSDFFRFENLGPVAILALIIAAINLVVGLVSWIPGIGWLVQVAVQFLLMLPYYVLLDRNVPPVQALRDGVSLVTGNLAQTLLFYVISLAVILAGFVACGVGILVAAPLVALATAYLYRRLTGEQPQIPPDRPTPPDL